MNPILVALDRPDLDSAKALVRQLDGRVGGFKVGLELVMSEGPRAISEIAAFGSPVFADLKLHDIPNTVGKAARQVARHGARWVTVHSSGGGEMIEAAVNGLASGGSDETGVLAVTVLTSLDSSELEAVGVARSLEEQVGVLSRIAETGGAEGVICSPKEAGVVKSVSTDLITVTPGVRLDGGDVHDQKRVSTPLEAVKMGADLLVIGRAITSADNPGAEAERIADSLRLAESL